MKHLLLVLFVAVASAVASATRRGHGNVSPKPETNTTNSLTIRTRTGTYTGLIDATYPNTRQFRSIPFAEPPVGGRRWLPPKKLSPATSPPHSHRYSTKFPPSCPQFVSGVEGFWNSNYTRGNLIYNGGQNDTSGLVGEATSEDCLHLAVWTPKEIPKKGLPVLFFMTGGGFSQGGVDLPWQIPVSWVDRSKSHIVVSINYRLNIFGFPRARGLRADEQNLGILDQRIALEWVRDNIAAFGGDPARIMHWGRSAGAISADIHQYAYADDPIAQSYYLESGTTLSSGGPPRQDPTFSSFSFVAQHVGCGEPCGPGCEDRTGKAELDCMRAVSMAQISNFVGQYQDSGAMPSIAFGFTVDEKTYFGDYKARGEAGKLAKRPTLVSMTAHEFTSLVPWPKDNVTEGPWQPPVIAATAAFAVCSTLNSSIYRNKLHVPFFRFQYAATFPNLNVYKWLGAYHNAETPLLFGTYHLLDHIAPSTDFQKEVSVSMQDHVLAFARDPYNGPQKLGWEPQVATQPNGGRMLRFGGKSGKVVEAIDAVEVDGVCYGTREYDPYP